MAYPKVTTLLTNSSSARHEPYSSYFSYESSYVPLSSSKSSSRAYPSAISFVTLSPAETASSRSRYSGSVPYYPIYSLPPLSTAEGSSISSSPQSFVTLSHSTHSSASQSQYSQSYVPVTYTSTATVYRTQTPSEVAYTQPYVITGTSTTITTAIVTTGSASHSGAITTDMAYYNQHILSSHHSPASLSKGAIAGAVVGAILGVGALLFIIFCCCKWKRRGTDAEKSLAGPLRRKKTPQLLTSQPPRFDSEKYNNTQEDLLGLSDLRQGLLRNQVFDPPTRLSDVAASPSPPPSPDEVINSPTRETFDDPPIREERLMEVLYEEQDPSEHSDQDVFAPTYKSNRYNRYNVGISMPPGSYPPKRKPTPPPPRKSGLIVQDTLSSMQFRPQSESSLSSISFTDDESV